MMSFRSASVFAIDLNCPAASLMLAAELCRRSAEETMLFAPRDEMALIVAGTSGTHNPLRLGHISVPCALAAPTVDFLESSLRIAPPPLGERHEVDFLETLAVCHHVICERTTNKRYRRVVYLVTDARVDVARKAEIKTLMESFRQHDVSLVVIGIDFTDPDGTDVFSEGAAAGTNESEETNLANLSVKEQNERVLHLVCSLLGGDSMVVSLEEALESVGGLRWRAPAHRPLLKVTLSIGDVRLATQMFTKTQEERLPALKKVTTTGEEVRVKTTYAGLGADTAKLQTGDFVKGYHYGNTFIPCAEIDVEAMKIKGPRALDAVAFVPLEQVPVYVLLSGVKVIMPLADDVMGARAFRSIVRAMAEKTQAMIVRFVRTPDADPAIGICVPSISERRDVLFFSLLPFVEDVRFFRFSEYNEMQRGTDIDKTEEARLIESIVEEMTVGKDVLRPRNTFNPVIQQYYATLRAKLRRCCQVKHGDEEEECHQATSKPLQGESVNTRTEMDEEVFLPLLEDLRTTSTAFGSPGNQLEPILSGVRAKLEACSRTFVFTANKGKRLESGEQPNCSCRDTDTDVSTRAPSTVATPCFTSDATHITSIGHVDSAQTMPRSCGAATVRRALDELVDVIFGLFRFGLKDTQYAQCADCVVRLRQCCVAEGDAAYFNSFLLKLQLTAKELGCADFWRDVIVGRGLGPIAQREIPRSAAGNDGS